MKNNDTKFKIAKSRLLGTLDADIAEMLLLASKLNIDRAEVSFNGSGDSGDVDDPELYEGKDAKRKREWDQHSGKYVDLPGWTDDHERLKSLVAEYAGKLIDGSSYDWYNDEGGGGSVDIDLAEGKAEMHLHQYERVQVNEEFSEYNLLPTDEEEL